MTGTRTAGVIALLMAMVITAFCPGLLVSRAIAAQDAPDEVIEIGSGPIGERTTGLVGQSILDGDAQSVYGYLNAIVGLGPEALFSGSAQSVETARFTFVAELAIGAAENRADVSMSESTGEFRIYLSGDEEADATWDEPASFADGQLLATYELELRETRQNQAPGVGVVAGDGQMTQRTAEEFAIAGQRYRFGVVGIEQRLRFVGAQVAATTTAPALVTLTGHTTVTRRESVVVLLGSPGAATPAAPTSPALPASGAEGCDELAAWFDQTAAALTEVDGLRADAAAATDLAALDPDELRQDAARAADLIAAQRELAVPDAALDAHRLAVTATSTTARGLQLLADAAAQSDTARLEQGQAALRDGAELAGRATGAAQTAAAACR